MNSFTRNQVQGTRLVTACLLVLVCVLVANTKKCVNVPTELYSTGPNIIVNSSQQLFGFLIIFFYIDNETIVFYCRAVNLIEIIHSLSTLFNFVSSSAMICLTGFNVTVSMLLSNISFLLN